MKKISFLLMTVALMLGFASCSEDRDPVYHNPTNFVLNTPAMQDQLIELQAGQALELVASQPDYGYSAVAVYAAQMSLTEDFEKVYDIAAFDGTESLARFVINQGEVATGICKLLDIEDSDAYKAAFPDGQPPMKVYFRATCHLNNVPGSEITSNVVSYNMLQGYFAVPEPGFIYLVGSPEGWAGPEETNAEHYKDWRLFESKDAIGSKVYTGVFDIPAASTFRFYTALTGWSNGDSYGSQVDDNPISFPDFTGGSFATTAVNGKGSFDFPNWPGGKMTITVDMSDKSNVTVTFQEGEHSVVATKYIYLIGAMSGWKAPSTNNEAALNPYRLADTTGDGIYTAKYEVAAGDVNFRFATVLTDSSSDDWDNPNQIGSQADDGDVECSFDNNSFSGSYMAGKGNYKFTCPADGYLEVTVDTNQKTVIVVFTEK